MARSDKRLPAAADPKPGRNPGYPETHPRDRDEARRSGKRKPPNPDAGGLDRDPEQDGKPDR